MADLGLIAARWLITLLVHSTALYLLVMGIERLRLVRTPAAREHLWRAAMVGALLTATIQSSGLVSGPSVELIGRTVLPSRVLTSRGAVAEPAAQTVFSAPLASPAARSEAGSSDRAAESNAIAQRNALAPPPDQPPAESPAGTTSRWLGANWMRLLFLVWIAGIAVAALRLIALAWLVRRDLRSRRTAAPELVAECTQLCAEQKQPPAKVSICRSVASPISMLGREIVLPPWAIEQLDRRQRRAMFAHELAHQSRRDPEWQLLALLLNLILWPQPLQLLARRRLRELAELNADAWAAGAIADRRSLAECLAVCAEEWQRRRIVLFGAAMRGTSPLLARVDRLLGESPMNESRPTRLLRAVTLVALLGACFALPGCRLETLAQALGGNRSSVTISHDGDSASASITRAGYSARLQSRGKVTLADDESDVVSVEPGGEFEIEEKQEGTSHRYEVRASAAGLLSRSFEQDGSARPFDAEAKRYLQQAIPRIYRESAFDIEARVARLLKRGGADAVIHEASLCSGEWARAQHLRQLFTAQLLDPEALRKALTAAAAIDSDYELRTTLSAALASQSFAREGVGALLEAGSKIGSDYERAEFLIATLPKLPADSKLRSAWAEGAQAIGSDYEKGRTLQAAIGTLPVDPAFIAALLREAAPKIDSDYDLRTLIEAAIGASADAVVLNAAVEAAGSLDSDYDRGTALQEILNRGRLDEAALAKLLEHVATMSGSYEKRTVLIELTTQLADKPALADRLREIARSLADYERGEVLRALDDANI